MIESVHASPGEWPLAPTVPDRFGVRRRLVPGFPYSVVYKELEKATWVVDYSDKGSFTRPATADPKNLEKARVFENYPSS